MLHGQSECIADCPNTDCIATIHKGKGGNCIRCNRDAEQPNCIEHYKKIMEQKHIQCNDKGRIRQCIKTLVTQLIARMYEILWQFEVMRAYCIHAQSLNSQTEFNAINS